MLNIRMKYWVESIVMHINKKNVDTGTRILTYLLGTECVEDFGFMWNKMDGWWDFKCGNCLNFVEQIIW